MSGSSGAGGARGGEAVAQAACEFGAGGWRWAAYNCGEGRVAKTMARYGRRATRDRDDLPAETQMYVPKVEATWRCGRGRTWRN